jgi:hypothetical protein
MHRGLNLDMLAPAAYHDSCSPFSTILDPDFRADPGVMPSEAKRIASFWAEPR